MKRPAFQFYPADWRKDAALQSCSLSAQGLWVNMLCIAHECEPYGHLSVNGNPMQAAQLARLVGLSARECSALLEELEGAGVFSRTDTQEIFSRRMVSDEELRRKRAEGGGKGAEHGDKGALYGGLGGRPKGAKKPPLNPPPSSSSSSSASTKRERSPSGSRLTLTALPDDWKTFCQQERADLDPLQTFERFKDYWTAKPGKDGRKADWLATWRNWVRAERSGLNGHDKGPAWWASNEGIQAKAAELGIVAPKGGSWADLKALVSARLEQ